MGSQLWQMVEEWTSCVGTSVTKVVEFYGGSSEHIQRIFLCIARQIQAKPKDIGHFQSSELILVEW